MIKSFHIKSIPNVVKGCWLHCLYSNLFQRKRGGWMMMAATLLDDQERVLEEVLRTSNRIIEQQVLSHFTVFLRAAISSFSNCKVWRFFWIKTCRVGFSLMPANLYMIYCSYNVYNVWVIYTYLESGARRRSAVERRESWIGGKIVCYWYWYW